MAVLGLSLLAAFSLSLAGFETLAHLRAEPWKLSALLILLLLVPLSRLEQCPGPEEARIRWASGAWIVAAVILQGYSAAVGWSTGHRLAVGLGGIGVLRMARLIALPHALLVAMAVPPPTILAKLTHPALSTGLADLSTRWMAQGTFLPGLPSSFPLPLQPSDGGLPGLWVGAAALLYLVFLGRSRGRELGESLGEAAWLALVGVALVALTQLVTLAAAAWLAGKLGPGVARLVLDFLPACCVLMIARRVVETTSAARRQKRALPLQTVKPGAPS